MNCLALLPVIFGSVYLVMVSVCVCARMHRGSSHLIRISVAVLGGLGLSALYKIVEFSVSPTPTDFAHAAVVVVGAIVIAIVPKLRTD